MAIKTISVLIGNSDNKLTQESWSDFSSELDAILSKLEDKRYFHGYSLPNSKYQTACFVCSLEESDIEKLTTNLANLAFRYNQDSIALVLGETKMIS